MAIQSQADASCIRLHRHLAGYPDERPFWRAVSFRTGHARGGPTSIRSDDLLW